MKCMTQSALDQVITRWYGNKTMAFNRYHERLADGLTILDVDYD